MTSFERPDWAPAIESGARILVTGASGGLGRVLVDMLLDGPELHHRRPRLNPTPSVRR